MSKVRILPCTILTRSKTFLICSIFFCLIFGLTANVFFAPTQIAHAEAVSDLLKNKPTGYVSDFAGILSVDEKNDIENLIRANATGFTTPLATPDGSVAVNGGATSTYADEIAVVTIKTLDGDSLEKFANELFRGWGIGQKGKDNGVLVLVAVAERQMRIEVGYGLEGSLTDLQTSQIINGIMKPAFREGKYGAGIREGVATIIQIINGDTSRVDALQDVNAGSGGNDSAHWFSIIIFFVAYVLSVLGSILGRSKSWWLGGFLGSGAGLIAGLIFSTGLFILVYVIGYAIIGLIFDYIVSKNYKKGRGGRDGGLGGWFYGGGGFGGSGGSSGGFGGFSGGSSGGGGSSGSW